MTATREQLVGVGEVDLCWQGYGEPGDPPLVLVAGAAASMDGWEPELCERIAAGGRHVVRYDHRDTGRSTTGRPGHPAYPAGALQDDLVGLVRALQLAPVHLVGISMGGGIAQAVALRHPELVAALTLVSTSAVGGVEIGAGPGPTARVTAYFEHPPADPDWSDAAAYAEWVLAGERVLAGSIPLDEQRVRETAARVHARSLDVAAAGNHWLAVGGPEEDDEPLDVRRIAAPSLVVHGSEDPLFPLPHARALADAVPGARLLVLPGVGHQAPPPSTWDEFVTALT